MGRRRPWKLADSTAADPTAHQAPNSPTQRPGEDRTLERHSVQDIEKDTPIGFVGLGNMGQPLSRNLLAAGFQVWGFDLNRSTAFEAAGGRQVASVAALAGLPLIVLSLPTSKALAATIDALLPKAGPGQTIVDLSSYALADKQAQAARLAERGAVMLDCEVSGLPMQAEQRKAVIFQSGDEAAAQRAKPVFDAMAEQHFFVGPFGSATRLKLIANTMVCVHTLMAAEALNLAARAGLDPALVAKVLGPSAAGSTTFLNKAPLMLSRHFDQGKGPFRHMFGYLARADEMARNAGAATPLLHAARTLYAQAEVQQRHDQDIAAVIELIEQTSATQQDAHHGR